MRIISIKPVRDGTDPKDFTFNGNLDATVLFYVEVEVEGSPQDSPEVMNIMKIFFNHVIYPIQVTHRNEESLKILMTPIFMRGIAEEICWIYVKEDYTIELRVVEALEIPEDKLIPPTREDLINCFTVFINYSKHLISVLETFNHEPDVDLLPKYKYGS